MGVEIETRRFEERDYERFGERLRESIRALALVLDRPGFGVGETTIGAELELHLVDGEARPAPVNRSVLAAASDRRLTLELDRFNLEVNADPSPIAGRPFSTLEAQLGEVLTTTRQVASEHGARVALIGILPTIEEADLGVAAITDVNRYAALSAGIQRARGGAALVRIRGDDTLELRADDVSLEGANASFQVHLRVAPVDFARTYNAAQLAAAPALALSTNSPLFLGKRLWEETRIALFRQCVEDRPDAEPDDWRPARVSFGHGWARRSALELFTEAVALHEPLLPVMDEHEHESPLATVAEGRVPALRELRMHCGTVWRWNRAVYDPSSGGHLRIEMRALPSGPTTVDMVAEAAFALGLTLGLAGRSDELVTRITFGQARRNFYQAARFGLDCDLVWPDASRTHVVRAPTLIASLLPVARDGLLNAGVVPGEADAWLAIVEDRVARGRTGSRWQRGAFDQCSKAADTRSAARAMLERYMDLSEEGQPIAEWPNEPIIVSGPPDARPGRRAAPARRVGRRSLGGGDRRGGRLRRGRAWRSGLRPRPMRPSRRG
jgi:gamma-glutamyl:cysteine ligase YbdK (ATP-grasp superfamily)